MRAGKKELNNELLRSSIQKLLDEGETHESIRKRAGVYNLSRVLDGKIKNPYLNKWLDLHNAYPLTIPEPEYMDGTKVFSDNTSQTVNAQKVKQRDVANIMTINKNKLVSQVSPEEQSFLNLLQKLDATGKYLRKFTRELMELMDKEGEEDR